MPRVSWCKPEPKPKAEPEPIKREYLRELFDSAKRQRKMTYEQIAVKIGTPDKGLSIKNRKSDGIEKRKLIDLFEWYWALDVPPELFEKAVGDAYRDFISKRQCEGLEETK